MTPVAVIQNLQATDSRTEKEQVLLEAWGRGCIDFFRGAKLAYDVLMPFYVQKVAEIDEDDGLGGDLTMDEFVALAGKLHRRELTGHAARDAIHAAAARCDPQMWNGFYRRILLKDFRAGMTERTLNKVLGKLGGEARDYMVPVFGCQLAHDSNKHPHKMRGEKLIDVKLDGVRLLTFLDKDDGTVTQWMREGNQNENFPHITGALKPLLDILPISLVLDGEITGKSFQELMTQVNRKEKLKSDAAKLALFDAVPLAAFRDGGYNMGQADRHSVLAGLVPEFQRLTNGAVWVIPKKRVNLDTPEGQAEFAAFNAEALAADYEGIMIKDPDAPYEIKRTAAWLKAKPFIEVSLEIVGQKRGKPGTKYENVMGAVFCYGVEDGEHILTRCSGFKDDERADFEANDYTGFIAEIRADKITAPSKKVPLIERMREILKDEEGVKPAREEMQALADRLGLSEEIELKSLRFPRFKNLRGTKPGEKL